MYRRESRDWFIHSPIVLDYTVNMLDEYQLGVKAPLNTK